MMYFDDSNGYTKFDNNESLSKQNRVVIFNNSLLYRFNTYR